jgi:acyl-CoA thioesterase-1
MADSKFEYRKMVSVRQLSVLVVGDSLASGFGSVPGFFVHLEGGLRDKGWNVDVCSRAVPGAGADIAPYVAMDVVESGDVPDVVVIALGINDMICGRSPEMVCVDLDQAITLLKDVGAMIVLSGALVPFGEGGEYADRFEEMYAGLAQKHGVQLNPFVNKALLANQNRCEGDELFKPELMSDTIHPNLAGAKLMAVDLVEEIDCALKSRFLKETT